MWLCVCVQVSDTFDSLQFDPAPRAGEPLVSRRPPDYVSDGHSLHERKTRDYATDHDEI